MCKLHNVEVVDGDNGNGVITRRLNPILTKFSSLIKIINLIHPDPVLKNVCKNGTTFPVFPYS